MKNRVYAFLFALVAMFGLVIGRVSATTPDLSDITPVITGAAADLIPEIVIIVTALATIVLIGVLVNYGFKKLRSVGSK